MPKTKRELEVEIKKLKKMLKTREVLLDEMRENLLGQAQADLMLRAYIISMLEDLGGKWEVKKERITKAITSLPQVKVAPTEDTYILMRDEGDEDSADYKMQESEVQEGVLGTQLQP